MKKKLALPIIFYFFTQILFSESLIINDFHLRNINTVTGEGGRTVLKLSQNEYIPNPNTDLLVHFNNNFKDEVGNYSVTNQYNNISSVEKKLGSGSSFYLKDKGIIFSSNGDTIFSPGRVVGDFTIEFWAFQTIISEDTTLFSWKGVNKVESEFIPQKIKCFIEDRNIKWEFENLFIPVDFSKYTLKLKSKSRLIPNEWNHYLIRYKSDTGLIEFLLNGIPESVAYSTSTEEESNTVFPPYIGNFSKNEIYIGERLRGFIDELRISESFIEQPNLTKYRSTGSFNTSVIDINSEPVIIENIIINEKLELETATKYMFRVSDIPFLANNNIIEWMELNTLTDDNIGRYIQVRGDFFSNGNTDFSPRLENVEIQWSKIPNPPAPKIVISTPEKGNIKIEWNPVKHFDIDGYYLYFGEKNNNYTEMIDVGKKTSYTVEELEPNKIYYFSIRSYLNTSKSDYSIEIYERPK